MYSPFDVDDYSDGEDRTTGGRGRVNYTSNRRAPDLYVENAIDSDQSDLYGRPLRPESQVAPNSPFDEDSELNFNPFNRNSVPLDKGSTDSSKELYEAPEKSYQSSFNESYDDLYAQVYDDQDSRQRLEKHARAKVQPDYQKRVQFNAPQPATAFPQPQYQQTQYSVFQPFHRDMDEPEVAGVSGFVEQEMKYEPRHRSGTAVGANRVKLLNGRYYSFDYPVANQITEKIPFLGAANLSEFKYTRYHAITADPKEYGKDARVTEYIEQYPLRTKSYAVPRETELMVVCTMYNEDEILLSRTLKGVFKNIKTMYNDNRPPFGREAWKKIVVVVVADGRAKLNQRAKALMTLLGCYQEGVIQESVNGQDVSAHLFEYTTSFGIGHQDSTQTCSVPLVSEQTVPVQLMFLVKEQNAGKINSHRWAFNFLCPNIRPKIIALVDVGTEPGPDSIYKLWESFRDPKVGGACGEIRAMLGKHASDNDEKSIVGKVLLYFWGMILDLWKCMINPLVAAQNFEYKTSNDLDKPGESFYGFISVLPGAFSAYRYNSLLGDPLEAYFHGEDMKSDNEKPAGILESNMYLAEDRILCYQLVSKPHSGILLRYIHDAYATTDVPSSVDEFVNQRRRWLNGSFFAALYSIIHFYRIFKSGHRFGRKLMIIFEMCFQLLNIVLSWFALSCYFLIFRILTLQVIDTFIGYKAANICAVIFLWIYVAALALTFIIAFGNKPSENRRLYQLAFFLFSTIAVYMMFCVIVLTIEAVQEIKETANLTVLTYFKNSTFRNLTISLASTYLLYALSSLLFGDFFHLIACTVPYLLMSPSFVNVLGIFAFCNIDDISWGTKGAIKQETAKAAGAKTEGGEDLLLSTPLKDPDDMYSQAEWALENAKSSKNDVKASSVSRKNYAKGRTYTVLLWLATNFILIVVVLRTGGLDDYISINEEEGTSSTSATTDSTTTSTYRRLAKREYDSETSSIFMTVVLWIMALTALFRFVSCVSYRLDFFIRRRRFRNSQVFY